MSTGVDGATVLVTVSACATLSAGTVHLSLTAREGPAPGTWQYNLNDGHDNRGRIAGKAGHLDVLKYAAGICAAGYQPGTTERGLLEQFAAAPASEPRPRYRAAWDDNPGRCRNRTRIRRAAPTLPQPNHDYNKYLYSI